MREFLQCRVVQETGLDDNILCAAGDWLGVRDEATIRNVVR